MVEVGFYVCIRAYGLVLRLTTWQIREGLSASKEHVGFGVPVSS
jgi:hypothetical protein